MLKKWNKQIKTIIGKKGTSTEKVRYTVFFGQNSSAFVVP